MKDKNGAEIKPGDYILSEGKWEYLIKEVTDESVIKSWNIKTIPGPLILARGHNLKHTTMLESLDLSKVEIIKK